MMPAAVADAIQTFFRRSGREASTDEWHPLLKCFVVRVCRKSDDPVMEMVRDGRRSERQVMESIPLHEPVAGQAMTFRALDLDQMGPSGITRWLEEHDLWSGRGRYNSPLDASREAEEAQDKRFADRDARADEHAVDILRRRMRENGLAAPKVGWTKSLEKAT